MTEEGRPQVTAVRALEPWRHDIDLGPFSTFEVAERAGPYADIGHPKSRYRFARNFLPAPPASVLDVGCNAGGVTFRLQRDGYDATGVDSGIDPGLQSPNPEVFEDGDTEGLWEREADPIEQARYCKRVTDADADFIRADAFEYLPPDDTYDVVVSFGVLYHAHEGKPDRIPDVEWAKRFLDLLMASAEDRVLIETAYEGYEWAQRYITSEGHRLLASAHPETTPPGVRHFIVAMPGGDD